ncbi:MAG: hypothetical protein JNK23_09225 [Opitutaceae bacterium]|nr:hypothetical protein [Opitutaceae bacterium]
MNRSLLLAPVTLLAAPLLFAQSPEAPPPLPPPVVQATPRPMPANPAIGPSFQQQNYGVSGDTLISRQSADGILEGFKKAYVKDGAPRVVICVNRALIDPGEPAGSAAKAAAPTLADKQTVRDIERLFGRAFRHAGAQLADQKIAASLLPDTPGASLTGEAAAKDRQALANIADVAIEVLISSRNLTVPEVSGDVTVPVPDIQATAIRLKDSAIVGQATASDIIGKGVQAGRVIRLFGVADITEATALALMEDMLIGKK